MRGIGRCAVLVCGRRHGFVAGDLGAAGVFGDFARKFPDVRVKRGVRFVEDGNLATSGGLACGIDLALRVVERYYGQEIATQAAYNMEYQGQGWMSPDSNAVYADVTSER